MPFKEWGAIVVVTRQSEDGMRGSEQGKAGKLK